MISVLKLVKFLFGWAFVLSLIAWIWAPSYMSLERRVEINVAVADRLVAWTGRAELEDYNFMRIRAHEIYRAREKAERVAIARARIAAREERKANRDASPEAIVQRFTGPEQPEDDAVSQGAKFLRVAE